MIHNKKFSKKFFFLSALFFVFLFSLSLAVADHDSNSSSMGSGNSSGGSSNGSSQSIFNSSGGEGPGGGPSCSEGCLDPTQSTCLPSGARVFSDANDPLIADGSLYCSYFGDLELQLGFAESCQNNFECESNECSYGSCVDSYASLEGRFDELVEHHLDELTTSVYELESKVEENASLIEENKSLLELILEGLERIRRIFLQLPEAP